MATQEEEGEEKEEEVNSLSNHSFASCPPRTTFGTEEDMDSGLSSLKTRSTRSECSPIVSAFRKRCDSIEKSRRHLEPPSHSISNMISEATGPPERAYKIIFIGDASVGKTTFIQRVVKGSFIPRLCATLGVDFQVLILEA